MSAVRCGMPHVTKVRRISSSHRALDDNSHHSKRYSEMYKGRSQPSFFRNILRTLFGVGSPYNFRLGIYFPQLSRPLQCQLGFIVSDEQALKVMMQFKGSSGTMCCALCRNCVLVSSELDRQDRSLVNFAEHRLGRFSGQTDASVFQSVDYLSSQFGTTSKKEFSRMAQSLGFNH